MNLFKSVLQIFLKLTYKRFVKSSGWVVQLVKEFITFRGGTVAVVATAAAAGTVTVAAVADGLTHGTANFTNVHAIAVGLLGYLAFVAVVETVFP